MKITYMAAEVVGAGQAFPQISDVVMRVLGGSGGMHFRCLSAKRVFYFAFI